MTNRRPVLPVVTQRIEGARGRQSDGLIPRPRLLTRADLQRPEAVLTSSEARLTLAPDNISRLAFNKVKPKDWYFVLDRFNS